MSGQMQWAPDSDGKVHPDDSILLAYTRRQSLGKSWPSIHQHIVGCERCLIRCEGFTVTSQSITDMLTAYAHKRYYPPLTERLSEYVENPAAADLAHRKRQQERLREDLALGKAVLMLPLSTVLKKLSPARGEPRNKAMASVSIFSIPAVVFLAVLLGVFIALAYSISSHPGLLPFRPFGGISTVVSPPSRFTVPAHSTPVPTATPVANSTGNGGPTANVTPTSTTAKPTITLCMTQADKNLSRIRFCGVNFIPGDKVELIIQIGTNPARARHQVTVDAQGGFQDFWYINACKDVPNSVYAQDMAHAEIFSQVLQNIQFGKCVSQNSVYP